MEKQSDLSIHGIGFDWSRYNKSQIKEKILFLYLLKELCNTLDEPKNRKGRRPTPLRQQIFCMCVKTYCQMGGRRTAGELELCHRLNYIDFVPHFNSILNYFNNELTRDVLHELIEVSALPLVSIERKFAIDSSGISTRILHPRWSTIRQNYSQHHLFKKMHLVYGVLTNIVTACAITDGHLHDSPQLPELINKTSKHFKMDEVSADMGYDSRFNRDSIWSHGALPLIPFRKGTTSRSKGSVAWHRCYVYFKNKKEEFYSKYHLRSNAESGMWMIKQKFGDMVLTRTDITQTTSVLCKILCHNICVLIQEMFLIGIEPDFNGIVRRHAEVAQKRD